jgi:hypothetical protein
MGNGSRPSGSRKRSDAYADGRMRRVEPPKPVLVRPDGRWLDGDLRAWRRDRDRWLGFVCYSESPGLRWLEWVDAERVRALLNSVRAP